MSQRIISFRLSAIPAAASTSSFQLTDANGQGFVASVTFASAPASIDAASLAIVAALRNAWPTSANFTYLGDGVISVVHAENTVPVTVTIAGTLTIVRHTDRLLPIAVEIQRQVIVNEVTDHTAVGLAAAIGAFGGYILCASR